MEIALNLRRIRDRIATACDSCGRDPTSITLVAVTKGHGIEEVRAAYDLGLRLFGENRLQEALTKIEAIPSDAVWHFIGKLQSNKVRQVAQRFDAIHTLDNERQLAEFAKLSGTIDALIEVNIADEPQKTGIPVKLLDDFHKAVLHCSQVHFRGLMTIGPNLQDSEQMRPYFRNLASAGRQLGCEWLSMGMSDNFEVAIQEGSTHIRIGTALFGHRNY